MKVEEAVELLKQYMNGAKKFKEELEKISQEQQYKDAMEKQIYDINIKKKPYAYVTVDAQYLDNMNVDFNKYANSVIKDFNVTMKQIPDEPKTIYIKQISLGNSKLYDEAIYDIYNAITNCDNIAGTNKEEKWINGKGEALQKLLEILLSTEYGNVLHSVVLFTNGDHTICLQFIPSEQVPSDYLSWIKQYLIDNEIDLQYNVTKAQAFGEYISINLSITNWGE